VVDSSTTRWPFFSTRASELAESIR
jgi:hypothetical protein